jgi:DNA-directed RNA polymerase specialized sigma24 family protein
MAAGGTPIAPGRSELERALSTDPDLLNQIFAAAARHVRSPADAEDLAQTAITHAIARARRTGEPKPPVTFHMFVGSILNGLGANKRRSFRRNPGPAELDEARDGPTPTESSQDAHATLTEGAQQRQRVLIEEKLYAYMTSAGEPGRIPLRMMDLAAEKGIASNQQFAKEIGCSVQDIELAKKRIGHHGARIRDAVLAGKEP